MDVRGLLGKVYCLWCYGEEVFENFTKTYHIRRDLTFFRYNARKCKYFPGGSTGMAYKMKVVSTTCVY